MTNSSQIIPKGALLTVTTGSYSDYSVSGVFRATEEIRADELLAEWLAAHPKQVAPHAFEAGDFLAWVARKGMLEPLDSFEWHVDGGRDADVSVSDQPACTF